MNKKNITFQRIKENADSILHFLFLTIRKKAKKIMKILKKFTKYLLELVYYRCILTRCILHVLQVQFRIAIKINDIFKLIIYFKINF